MIKRLSLVGLLVLGLSQPASALVVFDPSNFSQNLLTAMRTLEQINNQVRQLQNEAQMLSNDARNMTGLNYNASGQLQTTLATTNRLLQLAQGLAFEVTQADATFARLYPQDYARSMSGSQMAMDARERWSNSLQALHTSLQMQAQAAQNFSSDQAMLTDLVSQSQNAVGHLQATQATNQLLALQARQAIQAQQLQITQGRAEAVEQARSIAADARAREVRTRFDSGSTRYTPQPVSLYNR